MPIGQLDDVAPSRSATSWSSRGGCRRGCDRARPPFRAAPARPRGVRPDALGEPLDLLRRRPRRSPRSARAARSRRARACSCTVSAAGSRCRSRNSCQSMFGLHRIDALLHQPAHELLEPPIDFLLDQHVGRRLHAAGQLLQQVVPHLVVGLVLGLVLQVLAGSRSRSASSVSELAHFLRELVVERRQFLAADALDRDVVVHRRARQLGDLVVGRIGGRERAMVVGARPDQVLVESRRVVRVAELDRDVLQRLRLVVARRAPAAARLRRAAR